uniref:Uncharacterized protein n=1 Tax=Arundo donax TaxID=35708 RepID=A0A0A8ZZG2_ARUDO
MILPINSQHKLECNQVTEGRCSRTLIKLKK